MQLWISSQLKKIEKHLKNAKGQTIIELIVSMAIITIFFISLVQLLTVGTKIYLRQVTTGNAEVAVETIADDIKGYMMYGTEIKIFYVLSAGDKEVAGTDFSAQPDGAELYIDPEDPTQVICQVKDVEDVMIPLVSPEQFYGNGIDLGYKKIYLDKSSGKSVIEGLAYGAEYYRGLDIQLKIRDKSDTILNGDPAKRGLYEVDLAAEGQNGHLHVKSNVAVTGLNNKL